MGVRKNVSKGKKATVIAGITTVVVLLVGLFWLHTWEKSCNRISNGITSEEPLTYFDGGWYRLRNDVETVLLLGIDKAALDEEMPVQGKYEQSDFLMLLVIDNKAKTFTGIHINRDTMTEIQILSETGKVEGRYTGQITLAHTYGREPKIRCRNAVAAVSNLMYEIKIDHYISIMMDGVVVLNDLVGGVTLEVMDDFSGLDDTLVQGETVTLMGQHALNYIRMRLGLPDQTNLHRMERQRQYLKALQSQLLTCTDIDGEFTMSVLTALNDYIVSNCTVEQLSSFLETLEEYGMGEYRTLEGEAVLGQKFYEYYVDDDALRRTVMELFYELVRED